jgi:hypothetical protein
MQYPGLGANKGAAYAIWPGSSSVNLLNFHFHIQFCLLSELLV